MSDSSSSDDDVQEKIDANTSFATVQPEEKLEDVLFEREDDEDPRIMVEVPAGSNLWYQANYETESLNEIKLYFPGRYRCPCLGVQAARTLSEATRLGGSLSPLFRRNRRLCSQPPRPLAPSACSDQEVRGEL